MTSLTLGALLLPVTIYAEVVESRRACWCSEIVRFCIALCGRRLAEYGARRWIDGGRTRAERALPLGWGGARLSPSYL